MQTSAPVVDQLAHPVDCYLSEAWVLSYYGLIKDLVFAFTFASRVPPIELDLVGAEIQDGIARSSEPNRAIYQQIAVFDGFERIEMNDRGYLIATREKALVDAWTLDQGDWPLARLAEERYERLDDVNPDFVLKWAAAFQCSRVMQAAEGYVLLRKVWMDRGHNCIPDAWKARGTSWPI